MPDQISTAQGNPTDKTIEEYKQFITSLMEEKSAIVVENSSAAHAAALYELFFDRARSSVLIFCKNLAQNVFENVSVISAIRRATKARQIEVRIIVQEEKPESKSLLDLSSEPDGLKLRLAHEKDSRLEYNFCVKDQESYRFEKKKDYMSAFAKMYHPEEGQTLYNHFSDLWARSQPLPTP